MADTWFRELNDEFGVCTFELFMLAHSWIFKNCDRFPAVKDVIDGYRSAIRKTKTHKELPHFGQELKEWEKKEVQGMLLKLKDKIYKKRFRTVEGLIRIADKQGVFSVGDLHKLTGGVD